MHRIAMVRTPQDKIIDFNKGICSEYLYVDVNIYINEDNDLIIDEKPKEKLSTLERWKLQNKANQLNK